VRVSVYDSGLGRPPEAVETTIYFCCLESLQNAAKHAGPDAIVSIRLDRVDGRARFSIEDDGAGFDLATAAPGAGLSNLASRVAAVGGRIAVETRAGGGTRVTGDVPV
jgi:signal transduction histidine kinase